MKRAVLTLVAALALGLSVVGGVSAASDKHLEPGTPGTANCQGQTTAYLAQAAKNGLIDPDLGVEPGPGIGNLAKAAELSVKEAKAVAEAFCNPTPP
jgi:hypothetical protein